MRTALLTALLLAAAAPAAAQTTRTVCASGCNHTTLSDAMASTVAGDTIEIQDSGTYAETLNGVSARVGTVTVQVAAGESPTIDCEDTRDYGIDTWSNWTITGPLTVRDCLRDGIRSLLSGLSVSNVTVVSSDDAGIEIDANGTIADVTITGGLTGIAVTDDTVTIDRTTISGTSDRGITAGIQPGVVITNTTVEGAGRESVYCTRCTIEHVTVSGQTSGICCLGCGTGGSVRWSIAHCSGGIPYGIKTGTCEYGIAYGAATADTDCTTTTSMDTADPLLTDVPGGDLTLQSSSPAIDAATGSTETDDVTGTGTRDGSPDIGAHEYLVTQTPKALRGGAQGLLMDGGSRGYLLLGGAH